jgi:hypothetical protein
MITKPALCSKVDLEEFCKLVRQGDEVEAQRRGDDGALPPTTGK